MVPLENYLVLSAIIFSLGVYGVLARCSAILILMSRSFPVDARPVYCTPGRGPRCFRS